MSIDRQTSVVDDDLSVSCTMCWCHVINKHVHENQRYCKTKTNK